MDIKEIKEKKLNAILKFSVPSIIAMLFTYPLMVVGTVLGMFIRTDGKPQVCMLASIGFIPKQRCSSSTVG